jgi:S-adenosylmethionine:tRNA ribosyltransferase-isomerase
MTPRLSDFDYPLDPALVAQAPAARRDVSRLMVLRRSDGAVAHRVFRDLPELLCKGDLLVVNDTRVLPARFDARRATGGKIEGLFVREPAPGHWEVMLRGAGRCREGEMVQVPAAADVAVVLRRRLGAGRWEVDVQPPQAAADLLARIGRTPLPPYIRRPDATREADDRRRYQTVYAGVPGAVAAPTAGLHFTEQLLDRLAAGGIDRAQVTLHVGPDTFAPVRCEDLGRHRMQAEWYELPAAAGEKLNAARQDGRRVVAVGTTAVRVLESAAPPPPQAFEPRSGWTDLFIHPPAAFRAVDALITNFHLPRSTPLMLAAAFCAPGSSAGVGVLLDAYAEAARRGYRFYSYGDAMLIE